MEFYVSKYIVTCVHLNPYTCIHNWAYTIHNMCLFLWKTLYEYIVIWAYTWSYHNLYEGLRTTNYKAIVFPPFVHVV